MEDQSSGLSGLGDHGHYHVWRIDLNKAEFLAWAKTTTLDCDLTQQIANHAPETEEYVNLYSLQGISKMYESNAYNLPPPSKLGFLLIGSCMNGDQIVADVSNDVGSVFYLSCGSMHKEPRKFAKVADSLDEFMRLADEDREPSDYYDASL